MRTLRITVLAWLAISSPVSAQQTGEVTGTVYDSVARAPLRGAIVQMLGLTGTPSFTDSTDSRGRFTFRAVPIGQYFVEFTHPVLDSLALELPLSSADVRADATTRLSLAVPSPATIITQACRTTPADSAALFFGMLRDARTGRGLDDGRVTVRWTEIVIDRRGFNSTQKNAFATSRDGWFATCGVPAATEVVAHATHGADSTGIAVLTVPAHGLIRFDFDVGGLATIRGRVTSEGRPVHNARVRAGAEERFVYTDSSGAFRLGGVPAGTQTVDVRALGYAPHAAPMSLRPDAETEMNVELTTVKRMMDTIRVLGQRVYSVDAIGFERRRKAGWGGVFFDADVVRRRGLFSVMQLLNEIPSLRIQQNGFERTVLLRGIGNECAPAFFLNGMLMPSDLLSDLDLLVRPEELEGMEVYRGQTPPEFFTTESCGAVVVWTRRSPRRAR